MKELSDLSLADLIALYNHGHQFLFVGSEERGKIKTEI